MPDDIQIRKEDVAGIPCLTCRTGGEKLRPLVIFCHGFTQRKDDASEQLRQLSACGYLAVGLDNRLHGERPGPKFTDSAIRDGKLDVYQTRKAIKETADDVVAVIDRLVDEKRADPERMAVTGGSMGGSITFRVVVIDPRIKVAAPIVGSPYREDIPGDSPVMTGEEDLARLKEVGEEFNPARYPQRFFPRALLIQIAENDRHVNGEKVKEFYNTLKPYYTVAPDILKLIVHPHVGHEGAPEMWENATHWMRTHL